MDGLAFGWRTAILTIAAVQLILIAASLWRSFANRTANRTLAVLLIVLTGVLMPWLIGFAGFYDRWQWLTFAPFQITLAVGPLIYCYAHALVTGHWPRGRWHLVPAAAQAAFLIAGFALPMPLKDRWADFAMHPYGVVADLATIAGLGLYGIAGLRLLARYRALLATQRSDDHRFAAAWLSRAIGATLALLPVWAGYAIWDAVSPLGYTGLMGLYLSIAAFALYLAVEGWRHAALPFPRLADLAVQPVPSPGRDWRETGERWAAEMVAKSWHLDPDLSLPGLARRLGTNTSHLSRALNEGVGLNFSSFVGRLRSETVAKAIRDGRGGDLLDLALQAGFSSKASFNRSFLATFGMTPSAYRRAHVSEYK
ncbi:MAG: AraC family transcriptional regulator [Sphingomonadales bacterium]|nr:MAG: AraC family transcriptional regulator [Sphingomonadales bacterium]